jgi:tetratricopeptide (TPR) repeat protein
MGSYHEADASMLNPEDFQTLSQRERIKRERMLRLVRAEGHYREALRYDEHYPRALTRLGRVLHLNNHSPEAKTFLERGVQEAKLPGDRYLAALFMGALQFELNEISAARASYERALTILPASQTAVIALGYLEVMSGRPDRAQLLARQFTQTPPEPWWGYKDGNFDMIGLESLRARVTRR